MRTRAMAALLSISGGVAWIVRWLLQDAGAAQSQDELRSIGLALILASWVCVGLGMVKATAWWLGLVVGAAAPLLVWTVYETVHTWGSSGSTHLVLGVFAVVTGFVLATGARRDRSTAAQAPVGRVPEPQRGRHSRV
ncbi:hypothetical protein [Nocardioides yefusunii]|uniref:Uncharacterized protein n=1 Tax=Nocardioides yefusunii TaxID=2500546 RepID=A0ABW1QVZ2_9ACTN|nr:hypothetical protein [Nocardioides yefusunii]